MADELEISKRFIPDYSIDDLIERANYMRGLNEISLCSAGSGHSGGTLGIMDICAALYLKIANHNPQEPLWEDRDRIIWSAGHKAPALYTSLAVSGYYPEKEIMKLRMLGAPFQGHPHHLDLPGVEISSGSLGQGFSVGVGVALAVKLDKKNTGFLSSHLMVSNRRVRFGKRLCRQLIINWITSFLLLIKTGSRLMVQPKM